MQPSGLQRRDGEDAETNRLMREREQNMRRSREGRLDEHQRRDAERNLHAHMAEDDHGAPRNGAGGPAKPPNERSTRLTSSAWSIAPAAATTMSGAR